jgi:tripartite-type tricarboxylate transporter receptor subunit TctC
MKKLIAALAALLALSASASAQSVEEFYRGKQMKFVASYAAGTDYDTWTRLIARYYPKYIPGKPTMIVQNMAGAGGLQGANHLANLAERDGTLIMMIGRNLPYQALTKDPGVRFDPTKFNWIGSPEVANRVCAVLDTAPVKKAEDLFTTEALMGGNGSGSAVSATPNLLSRLLGMKFKIIEGYPAPSDIILAMERGELHGFCSSYLAMHQTPGWLENGRLKILFNLEHEPIAETRAPSIYQFAKTDEQRRILSIFNSSVELGRPIAAPPGVPEDRVAALRAAFEQTMKDPELIADAEKQKLEIEVVTGAQVQTLIEALLAAPPELVERVNSLTQGK